MRVLLTAAQLVLVLAAPAAAQSAPQLTPEQQRAIATACRSDIEKLCAGIQPGGGRIGICLREKFSQVTAPCRTELIKARRGG
jgi:hypothetical protein